MIILMAAKQKAKDKREEPSLNGKAGVVSAVKAPAGGAGGLLRSCPLEGQKSFLPSLFPHCRGLFLGSNVCLCCFPNGSGMFCSDAVEEPECLVSRYERRVGGAGFVGQRRCNSRSVAFGGHGDAAGGQSGVRHIGDSVPSLLDDERGVDKPAGNGH